MSTFLAGFGLGLSLILAIGSQNAFVLRQGIRRSHVLAVVLTCAISDALLVTAGVAGFGWLVERLTWLEPAMRYGGAAFLIIYGLISLRSALRPGTGMQAAEDQQQTLGQAVSICLALTWLNPHVYLDTVVLLGSVSTTYDPPWLFGLGAVCASFTFFFSLGYGARLLAPLFARPSAWRILDGLVALTMFAIAASLIL
ncbi:LysE/ArgO family amino acid transporter [Palleronia caenipelagi]|uniref:Amino acid transporter n=1 Tax=Palleronia caenipelagi TaxID=2489174 RepID=A0A547Q323_9RHOB|nr:LysE/ArgO family amino acid transporter [Palleronia caenipelagi]TRD20770.1 amino acid transporter [Palleronia caenipelagi]